MKILALSAAAVIVSLSAGTVLAEEHKGRHDGPMTKAEFMAKAAAKFEKMDADNNGTISPEEHKAAKAKMREHHKERRGERMEKREGGADKKPVIER